MPLIINGIVFSGWYVAVLRWWWWWWWCFCSVAFFTLSLVNVATLAFNGSRFPTMQRAKMIKSKSYETESGGGGGCGAASDTTSDRVE